MQRTISPHILPIIVISQLFCTSLWFAGNAILPELQREFQLSGGATGLLTSSVQLGFISGTLIFAFLKISDRFSPSKVFLVSALAGSMMNLSITFLSGQAEWLIFLRFLTGFSLAGIYPVGMKIASDYHQRGLGMALGYLVGALVIGTASPHLLKNWFASQPWQYVLYSTSALALIGGVLIGTTVPNGPFRKTSPDVDLTAFFRIFKAKKFRAAAFGYFGHMWELYAFWAFIPTFLAIYNDQGGFSFSVPFASFSIIAIGGLSCVLGGYFSFRWGSNLVAFLALLTSLVCCLLSIFSFQLSPFLFIIFLLIWGMAVITDSPQFSTLVAQYAPADSIGTALTIVNSLGFVITIGSIQLLSGMVESKWMFLWLAPGPLLGLLAFYPQHIRDHK